MSTKIKELAVQAGFNLDEYELTVSAANCTDQVYKFAELIVRDIIATLETDKRFYADPEPHNTNKYYAEMKAKEQAVEYAVDTIRYKFGVE